MSMRGAENRWRRLYGSFNGWGVRIERGMRLKDLPQDMRIAAEPRDGAQHPFTLKGGRFVHLTWRQGSPLHWPKPTETALEPGDYLTELPDGGIGYIKASR